MDDESRTVANLAAGVGLASQEFADAYQRVHDVLSEVFEVPDSGMGMGFAEFSIRIDGRPYRLVLTDAPS